MNDNTNSKFINETLNFLVNELNKRKIDFYIVGALGAYIDAGLPIERTHDDIDIMIEEKHIDDLKDIFIDTDFIFYDNRLSSNKVLNKYGYTEGDHEVCAIYKNDNFHIGFFLFHCDSEYYTMIDYFRENDKQKKLERTLPIEFLNKQHNPNIIDYHGMKIKVIRKETIYKNKLVMNREKDLFDLERLKPKIDMKKLDDLNGISKYRKSKISEL